MDLAKINSSVRTTYLALTDSHLADLQKSKDCEKIQKHKQTIKPISEHVIQHYKNMLQKTICAILFSFFLTSCKNMYLHMSVELLAVVLLEERLLILRIGCRQVREEQIKESEVRSQ